MPAGSHRSFDLVSQGFRALAQRRHAYYLELLQSGRWRHYFSEQEFAERLRDVMNVTRFWNKLVENGPATSTTEERTAA
jgi:hypothetical protein